MRFYLANRNNHHLSVEKVRWDRPGRTTTHRMIVDVRIQCPGPEL